MKRISITINEELLNRIDMFRKAGKPYWSRSEAIRDLCEAALVERGWLKKLD